MATGIYKRGNMWWIRYTGLDGRQKREPAGEKFQAAVTKLAQRKSNTKDQELETKRIPDYLFSELTSKYEAWIAGRQASAAVKGYIIGQLKKHFGDIKLRSFNTALVDQLQTSLIAKNYKAASNNKVLNVLKAIFTKAVEWEMVEESVLKRIRKVKAVKNEEKRLRYLSADECNMLVSACDPHLRPIVVTAMNTGMRRGEILGLKWSNMDLKNGFILLDKTKNGERREIPINGTLRGVLSDLPRRIDIPYVFFNQDTAKPYRDIKKAFLSAKNRIEIAKCPDCEYRYPRLRKSAGSRKPLIVNGVSRVSSKSSLPDREERCPKCNTVLLILRGIEDLHFHDLRHTFASHCIMAGVDITTLSKLLGHKSLKMTLRYSHLAPSHLSKAVDLLDKTINEKTISTKLAQKEGVTV